MVTLQRQVIKMTQRAVTGLFKTARHLSEDLRGEAGVVGQTRSVNSQLIECIGAPLFFRSLLTGAKDAASAAEREQWQAEMQALLSDLDAAEAVAERNYAQWYAAIEAIPDDKLEETHTLPFGSGMMLTTAALIFLPLSNLAYHTGQINYLQMQHGDTENHW